MMASIYVKRVIHVKGILERNWHSSSKNKIKIYLDLYFTNKVEMNSYFATEGTFEDHVSHSH